MDQLSDHLKLLAQKTIENQTQIGVIIRLFKIGFNTEETINLLKVLRPTINLTDNQRLELLCMVEKHILKNEVKNEVIEIINIKP